MKIAAIYLLMFCAVAGCTGGRQMLVYTNTAAMPRITGTQFYNTVAAWGWQQRDSLALREILSGNMPGFLTRFVPVYSQITDGNGAVYKAVLYVLPDYLSVGTDDDWARVPLTPMAAQRIADSFDCFLPTRKIVNLVWQQAAVKPEPVPMFAFRDSSVTMWQHHLIIEGQRRGRKGLIAGIKKDVVMTSALAKNVRPNRVAIYGWHRQNGQPIQPLYTGHVNWYVDYSHGIRLVYRKLKVNGRAMDMATVLQHPVLRRLVSDEEEGGFWRYGSFRQPFPPSARLAGRACNAATVYK